MLRLLWLFTLTSLASSSQFLPSISLESGRIPHWLAVGDPDYGPVFVQPEQVHIAYAGPNRISFTWITFDDVIDAIVEYGKDRLMDRRSYGNISYFEDGGKKRFVSRATVELAQSDSPGDYFRYRVGSDRGWSSVYEFRYLTPRPEGGYEIIVYGDLGNENARSMGLIQRMCQDGFADLIHHVGDFGYDLNTDSGRVGDEYFRQIESAAAYVPYMMTPGNHENEGNFTHYTHRFTSPTENPHFYSYDLDQIHFISFSTEFYYYTNYGWDQIRNQFEWLQQDLKKANQNRKEVPWIVTLGHRPMYCSDIYTPECAQQTSLIRIGINETHQYALEKLFYDEGVDLEIFAHQHYYERFYPVYNKTKEVIQAYLGDKDPYFDPPAPVHIISGSAGCRENISIFTDHPPVWSAFRSRNYGIGMMRVFNETHLRFKQIRAATGSVDDEIWLVKHKHGPYSDFDRQRLIKYGTPFPTMLVSDDFAAGNMHYLREENMI